MKRTHIEIILFLCKVQKTHRPKLLTFHSIWFPTFHSLVLKILSILRSIWLSHREYFATSFDILHRLYLFLLYATHSLPYYMFLSSFWRRYVGPAGTLLLFFVFAFALFRTFFFAFLSLVVFLVAFSFFFFFVSRHGQNRQKGKKKKYQANDEQKNCLMGIFTKDECIISWRVFCFSFRFFYSFFSLFPVLILGRFHFSCRWFYFAYAARWDGERKKTRKRKMKMWRIMNAERHQPKSITSCASVFSVLASLRSLSISLSLPRFEEFHWVYVRTKK